MKKRLLLPLLLCILSSCNTTSIAHESKVLKVPDIKYNQVDKYDKEQYQLFSDKLNSFSSKLSADSVNLYNLDKENFSVSPLSLYMALALVVECSNGNTRQEILDEIGLTYEQVNTFTKTLFQLTTRQEEINDEYLNDKQILSESLLTNSIWFDNELPLIEKGLELLSSNYYCYSHEVDFNHNNKEANKKITEFVKEHTKGLIDSDFKISKNTVFALMNTLYLKFNWLDEGEGLNLTNKEYEFTNYDNSITNTKLIMGKYYSGRIYQEETFSSFYSKNFNGYKLQFIVPNDGHTLDEVYTQENIEKMIQMEDYNAIDDSFNQYFTRCIFPEFEAECDIDYKELLEEYGINQLFMEADYSNIVDYSTLTDLISCDKIIHQTNLNVDKKGVEGAAVTIVVNELTGAPGSNNYFNNVYQDYIINKNFGFVITDRYNTVLFTGVINSI